MSNKRVATTRQGSRDSQANRASILRAATDEFAEFGLGGARVDRIAERAGANKRMLYYYFGNKDALFLAVLEATYANIRSQEVALNLSEAAPVDAVRTLVAFTWNYYLDHPEFIPLINSANLHKARHLKKSPQAQQLNSPLVDMLEDVLNRGRADGSFRPEVDAVQLYISIAGLSYFYLSNHHTLSSIFARDLMAPDELTKRLNHVTEVVLGFLVRPN